MPTPLDPTQNAVNSGSSPLDSGHDLRHTIRQDSTKSPLPHGALTSLVVVAGTSCACVSSLETTPAVLRETVGVRRESGARTTVSAVARALVCGHCCCDNRRSTDVVHFTRQARQSRLRSSKVEKQQKRQHVRTHNIRLACQTPARGLRPRWRTLPRSRRRSGARASRPSTRTTTPRACRRSTRSCPSTQARSSI